jgi:hypothetical protein
MPSIETGSSVIEVYSSICVELSTKANKNIDYSADNPGWVNQNILHSGIPNTGDTQKYSNDLQISSIQDILPEGLEYIRKNHGFKNNVSTDTVIIFF